MCFCKDGVATAFYFFALDYLLTQFFVSSYHMHGRYLILYRSIFAFYYYSSGQSGQMHPPFCFYSVHFCTVDDIIYTDACFVPRVFVHATTLITRIRSS